MQPSLFDAPDEPLGADRADRPAGDAPSDEAARDFAVDPRHHVVLEASAGTGKTRVLVDRFVRLLDAGIDPRHILAITFTRKAAAEMRDRVLSTLEARARADRSFRPRWRALTDRVADIQVSTIDAFCFRLLREFPLEAGVDPGFEIADETEMARFSAEALDVTFRVVRGLVASDADVRLLLAEVPAPTLREALASLVDRRHVLLPAVAAFVSRHEGMPTAEAVAAAFLDDVRSVLAAPEARPIRDEGPIGAPDFDWLAADLSRLDELSATDAARVRQFEGRLREYFFSDHDTPRSMAARKFKSFFASAEAKRNHDQAVRAVSPRLKAAFDRFDAGVDGLLARGLLRVLAIASRTYETLLEEHALLDFAAMLDRAVALLSHQEEFARSRLKLQSRYHHVLVDEFQDTSRQQWRLIERLVDAWREGEGPTDAPTSIFVVGDRKQSIYRFRQAEVALLDEAARKIGALGGSRSVRCAITHSFRAVPELLAFVNALGAEMASTAPGDFRFRYSEADRFPVPAVGAGARRDGVPVLGLIAERTPAASAAAIASEIDRLLQPGAAVVRDPRTAPRQARPDDIAILFRTRAGHRVVEDALTARGIRSYVYKGLGFFDAPEVQDLQALLRYLARPDSDLRAAEWLRSRFVRLSDDGLARIAPDFARALLDRSWDAAARGLDRADRAIVDRARLDVPRWIALSARATPGVVLDTVVSESAYAWELSGPRLDQARENIKKVRALVRRVENRGYATLDRLAEYFETLRAGEESNAIVAASGSVHLMTIHAAKGLEFPIVFLVNLHAGTRGTGAITVIDRDSRDQPHVAFGTTEETAAEEDQNREETRRLLYVGVTRARDRLYLGGDLDNRGRLWRRQTSLSFLLPATLAEQFGEGATGGREGKAEVEWVSGGQSFAFLVCRPPSDPEASRPPASADTPAPLDVGPLAPALPAIVSATGDPQDVQGDPQVAASDGASADEPRLLGTLVHRLFARGLAGTPSQADLLLVARASVSAAELADVPNRAALFDRAVAMFVALAGRPDVRAVIDGGICHYEVPFSYQPPDQSGVLVRGAVDCLVERPDGRLVVLEFKTGRPRAAHEAQVGLYVAALERALGTKAISAQIVYS
jgi:ATP-dependent helicase/nuclease subunit A